MARVKATTTDIFAKLARGECANFHSGCCQGKTPCTVVNGEACHYFTEYVLPLLDYPEFAGKYSRAAKIAVALNPRAKIVRKRRLAAEPALALDTPAAKLVRVKAKAAKVAPINEPVAKATTKPPVADMPVTTVVSVSGVVRTKPAAANAKRRAVAPKQQAQEQPMLLLEITPALPARSKAGKRR